MEITDGRDFSFVEQEFNLPGSVKSIGPLGSGHIHETYLITCDDPEQKQFVLQKFNHLVFKYPYQVADNIQLVYEHSLRSPEISSLQPLKPIKTRRNTTIFESKLGEYWRVFNYVESSDSYDQVSHPNQAFGAATAFGSFIQSMHGMNPGDLFTTITDFHNLKQRFKQLKQAIERDTAARVSQYYTEVDFALKREPTVVTYTKLVEDESIPLRVTHNDTKINNVLFQQGSAKAICVIDLDTVMPGLLLYDFGDMARTFCNSVLEEESIQEATFRMDIFEALCKGFFQSIKFRLSPAEVVSLKAGPWWMTYIMGIRFLADFLNGDVYYKTSHKNQNLDRVRNQFSLLTDIENKQTDISNIIESSY